MPASIAEGQHATRVPDKMVQTAANLAELMGQVARRDRRAFQQLYEATSAKLYGIVLRILHQRALADDVLQEIYVRIWERAADFDIARASPITWMATIARNRALDEVRRKTPVSLEEIPEAGEMAADGEHPLDKRERSQELSKLLACLEALEEDKRKMILLAYYRGMSRESLSQRFSAPVSTIKTWLHRSLAQLRTCLAK